MRSFKYRLYPTAKQAELLWQDRDKPSRPFTVKYLAADVSLQNSRLHLPKVGGVRIKLHRELAGEMKAVTIRRESSGRWYATFSVASVPQQLQTTNNILPRSREEFESRIGAMELKLKLAKMDLQRKQVGSQNWLKQQKKIARLHERLHFLKLDYWHQETTRLVRLGQDPPWQEDESVPRLARKMWNYKFKQQKGA